MILEAGYPGRTCLSPSVYDAGLLQGHRATRVSCLAYRWTTHKLSTSIIWIGTNLDTSYVSIQPFASQQLGVISIAIARSVLCFFHLSGHLLYSSNTFGSLCSHLRIQRVI